MKKVFLHILFCILFTFPCYAQITGTADVYRMVGNGSWSVVNDSVYTSTITFQADLTGQGYLANQIVQDSFRMITPLGGIYLVDSVANATFSTAEIFTRELINANSSPIGQVMVYDPDGRETVPQNPFGSTGATAQLQAAIDTYNASLLDNSVISNGATIFYTEDGFNTLVPGTTPQDGDIAFDLETGAKYQLESGVWLRISNNSGNLTMRPRNYLLGESFPADSVNFALYNSSGNLTGTIPAPSSIDAVNDIGSNYLICIFGANPAGTEITWDTIYNTSDGQDLGTTQQANSDYQCFEFRYEQRGGENAFILQGGMPGVSNNNVVFDEITIGSVTLFLERAGGTITSFTNPAAGNYAIVLENGAQLNYFSISGNNSNLNGSNEMIITLNNTSNEHERRGILQLYDQSNDALVDQQLTGTNHTQAVSGNTVTLTVPGLNGFGATGYIIEFR